MGELTSAEPIEVEFPAVDVGFLNRRRRLMQGEVSESFLSGLVGHLFHNRRLVGNRFDHGVRDVLSHVDGLNRFVHVELRSELRGDLQGLLEGRTEHRNRTIDSFGSGRIGRKHDDMIGPRKQARRSRQVGREV